MNEIFSIIRVENVGIDIVRFSLFFQLFIVEKIRIPMNGSNE